MCTKFTSPRKFAFTTVLLLFWTRPCLGNSGTFGIRVDKESDPLIFSLDHCTPVLPKPPAGHEHIYEIESNGNCLNVYAKQNCVGKFIRFQTNKFFSRIRDMAGHRWLEDGDVLVTNETIKISSIGPCLKICNAKNWAGMGHKVPVKVTVFDKENYYGNLTINKLTEMDCIALTPLSKSIQLSGTATSTCVELHDDTTCGKNAVQLRPGYPYLSDLWWWGFPEARFGLPVNARSLSFCGYSCPEVRSRRVTTVKNVATTLSSTYATTMMVINVTTTTGSPLKTDSSQESVDPVMTKMTTTETDRPRLEVGDDEMTTSHGDQVDPSTRPVFLLILIAAVLMKLG